MKSFGLPKRLLLKKPDQFKKLIKNGRRSSGRLINLYYLPAARGTGSVGFTTVKRLRRAVDRNRARRLMREVFRIHRMSFRKGNDYLFQWKGEVPGWIYADAEADITAIMRKEGLSQ